MGQPNFSKILIRMNTHYILSHQIRTSALLSQKMSGTEKIYSVPVAWLLLSNNVCQSLARQPGKPCCVPGISGAPSDLPLCVCALFPSIVVFASVGLKARAIVFEDADSLPTSTVLNECIC